ncbi:MAG: hypothetical protein K2I70_05820, partial [Bacilli bacterium]|nr:hypothetical protein [Bacilli bacterium]
MKLFKSTIDNLHKTIFVIITSSLIISFFNVVIAKFIIYIIDGIVMNNTELPQYLRVMFYDDSIISKIIVTAIFM